MFRKDFGNVIVDFGPLLIVLAIFALIFLIQLIRAIISELKTINIQKKIVVGDYKAIIKTGEKLLRSYQKSNSKFPSKSLISRIEYLNSYLAISYFSQSDDENFLKHINSLNENSYLKEFWLSLYYLRKNDIDNFQLHYDNISVNDETLRGRIYLESIKLYMQGDYDTAKSKISETYEHMNHVILKQIADEVLKSKN